MARIKQTQKLIIHSLLMNPDKEHHEHQHSDEEHNNILMVRMFTQNFK
jgi:hypothetical protein